MELLLFVSLCDLLPVRASSLPFDLNGLPFVTVYSNLKPTVTVYEHLFEFCPFVSIWYIF